MAEEHTNKVAEFESNVNGEGAVETHDRGMFDFLGKKKEDEKPEAQAQAQAEVTATDFEKVNIEHKEDEKNHSTLLEQFHRSDRSPSSSSDEEEGEEGEEKKKKKKKKGLKEKVEEKFGGEKKEDEPVTVHPESPEKKGFMEKIKEKLPGQHKKEEEVNAEPPPAVISTESVAVEHHEGESEPVTVHPESLEKKGFMEKIKEKLPGQHKKDEEVTAASPPAVVSTESVAVEHRESESETKEKKGILEKIKEKLPGYHSKTEDEKGKETETGASH